MHHFPGSFCRGGCGGERGGASLGAVQQLRLSTHRKSLGDRKWTRAWTQWVGEGTNASRGFLELSVVTLPHLVSVLTATQESPLPPTGSLPKCPQMPGGARLKLGTRARPSKRVQGPSLGRHLLPLGSAPTGNWSGAGTGLKPSTAVREPGSLPTGPVPAAGAAHLHLRRKLQRKRCFSTQQDSAREQSWPPCIDSTGESSATSETRRRRPGGGGSDALRLPPRRPGQSRGGRRRAFPSPGLVLGGPGHR